VAEEPKARRIEAGEQTHLTQAVVQKYISAIFLSSDTAVTSSN
jgi:hypothetical protein